MEPIKQKTPEDKDWINEIPIEEFDDDTEDFTDILDLED